MSYDANLIIISTDLVKLYLIQVISDFQGEKERQNLWQSG